MTSPTVPPEPPPAQERSRTLAAAAALLATISVPLAITTVTAQLTSVWYLAIVPAGVVTAIVAGRHAQRGAQR